MTLRKTLLLSAVLATAALATSNVFAAQAPAERWWVEKTQGGVYRAPMKPLWRKAELLRMHAGQNNWSEQIIKDPEQDVTYNSGAPGFRISPRLKPDTATVYLVIQGDLRFNIEGQQPIAATRGSIVNVPKTTIYSAEVTGDRNALWLEVNPFNYKVAYPAAEPQPAAKSGGQTIQVAFSHTPGGYKAPNRPHWNLWDALNACETRGARALDDHIFVNPLIAYADPKTDPCTTRGPNATPLAAGTIQPPPLDAPPPALAPPAGPAFNPRTTFGHMHAGPAEWWLVQAGRISGKFENAGEFHAVEGDVLYAAPMMWHQMGVEGSGPAVRTAMGGYNLINMGNTAGAGEGQ